jgi:hypothetical protein
MQEIMNIEAFRDAIKRREYVEKISLGEWAEGIEECCKKEIEILMTDIESTIAFLKNDCTSDEFVWISEIIDDLAAKTQSKELIECYKSLMDKFPEECKIYSIKESIEYAEAELTGESG